MQYISKREQDGNINLKIFCNDVTEVLGGVLVVMNVHCAAQQTTGLDLSVIPESRDDPDGGS